MSLTTVRSVLVNNPSVTIDLIKNCSDLLIPASRLNYVYLPSGVVGLLGVASSVAGLVVTYNERLKLKFS